jgi:hypothetical protein
MLEVHLQINIRVQRSTSQRILHPVTDREKSIEEQEVSVLLSRILVVFPDAYGESAFDPLVDVVSKDIIVWFLI